MNSRKSHNRFDQSLSIKKSSSPGKPCVSSYERNSTNSLSQQLAVSYQIDASGNRVQISTAPAGGAAAETGSYSYDASGRMLSGRDDKRNEVVNSLSYDGFGNRLSKSPGSQESPGSGLEFILFECKKVDAQANRKSLGSREKPGVRS